MLSLCFGVCAGVVIFGYGLMFKRLFGFIKRKISDRKAKKMIEAKTTDTE